MRLLRLDIHGFGRLRGRIDLDPGPGRLGLVLENNESGKSTLSAALLAALYGLDGDRRRFRGTISDVDRYRPWGGGAYGLTLTLRYQDQELVVERDLERDAVRVLAGGKDVTDKFQRHGRIAVGEGLTGLRKEQFTASCFVGQGDIVWADPARLTEALQRVADSRSGKSTAASALQALDHALTHYDGLTLGQTGRVETEIKRCEEILLDRRTALAQLEAHKREIDERLGAASGASSDDLWPNVQRRALRVRRLARELAAIEEVLAVDTQVRERIQAIDVQLAEDMHLDAIDDAVRARIERARQARAAALPEARRIEAELARWQAESAGIERELKELGLRRVPTDDEVASLGAAHQALAEIAEHRQRLQQDLEREKRSLVAAGYDVQTALALAHDFEDLDDERRVLLASHTTTVVEHDERRQQISTEQSSARVDLDVITRAQDLRRRIGFVLIALGVVGGAAGFAFADAVPLPLVATLAGAGVLVVAGIGRAATALRHRAGEENRLRDRVRDLAEDLRELDTQSLDHERRWSALADELGIEPELLEDQYREWRRVESRVNALTVLRPRLDALREDEQRVITRLAMVATIFERPPTLGELPDALRAARVAIEREHARAMAVQEIARLREGADLLDARRQGIEDELILALEEVGVACEDPSGLETALAEYDRRNAVAREREELRWTRLPALMERRLDDGRRHEATERARALREELPVLVEQVRERAAREGARGAALVATLGQTLGQAEYERELAAVEADLERDRERLERARAEIRSFLVRYGEEAAALRADVERHETALRRAEQFRDAVTLARDTLRTLGQQTHRIWAASLNKHANDMLRRMGSEVEDLRFDDTLEVQLRQRGHVITNAEVPRVLSAGAADAVFLAARLAVSRALSRDNLTLPLVLDDPLANADDERLLGSLRLLVDVIAPQQQVLLMACQHSRYDWAQGSLERSDSIVPLRLARDGAAGPSDPAS